MLNNTLPISVKEPTNPKKEERFKEVLAKLSVRKEPEEPVQV